MRASLSPRVTRRALCVYRCNRWPFTRAYSRESCTYTHKMGVLHAVHMSARSCYPGAWREVDRLIRVWRSCEAISERRKNRAPRNKNPALCAGAGQVRKWILVRIRMNRIAAVCQHNRLAKQSKIRGSHLDQTCDLFWKLYNWRKAAAVSNTCHLKRRTCDTKEALKNAPRADAWNLFLIWNWQHTTFYCICHRLIMLGVTLLFDNWFTNVLRNQQIDTLSNFW